MSIELNKIYNVDCLVGMKEIPDKMVDLVVVDPPYGIMNAKRPSTAWMNRQQMPWDNVIDTTEMFLQFQRIVRPGGYIIVFSAEPFTSALRTGRYKNVSFCYPCVYVKNRPGDCLNAKNAPVGYFEDINVFIRNNPKHDFDGIHPLRDYSQKILSFCKCTSKQIEKRLGHRCAEHFFYTSTQFKMCTEKTYNQLIEIFGIDKMDGFLTFEELKKVNDATKIEKKYPRIFNRDGNSGVISNVFSFPKDKNGMHPTQKPVALVARLIEIYSNPGDVVLDNCMGSGTTAIAAIQKKRNFIGFETDEKYFRCAEQRIKDEYSKIF